MAVSECSLRQKAIDAKRLLRNKVTQNTSPHNSRMYCGDREGTLENLRAWSRVCTAARAELRTAFALNDGRSGAYMSAKRTVKAGRERNGSLGANTAESCRSLKLFNPASASYMACTFG